MNILLLGPQGSGKGTQARLLVEKFGFFYFEAGGFLRELAAKNSTLAHSLAQGNLVPDAEMTSYVIANLDEKGIYDGILFDGFPRTVQQYEIFKNWLSQRNVKLDLTLVLVISREETVKRLSARRQDPETGKIYNLLTEKIPDNVERSKLIQREDDLPGAIKKRLRWYEDLVEPLIRRLKEEGEVVEINGEHSVDEIQKELIGIIKSHGGKEK